jgi:hypothetical protein
MDHGYEAARYEAPQQQFDTLAGALDYISGSRVGKTRPWLRVINGTHMMGTFLVVAGHKLNERCLHPLPHLQPEDQAVLDAWCMRPAPEPATSQHKFTGIVANTGRYIRVLAGYDRPHGKFFLTVFHGVSIPGNGVLFASDADAEHDWGSSEAVSACLENVGTRSPETFMEALGRDQATGISHRMVEHHFDAQPSILLA